MLKVWSELYLAAEDEGYFELRNTRQGWASGTNPAGAYLERTSERENVTSKRWLRDATRANAEEDHIMEEIARSFPISFIGNIEE